MCLWQQNSVKCKAMDQNNNVNCCVHKSPGDARTRWWWWQQKKYVWIRGHQYYKAKPAVQMARGKLVLKQNGVMEGPVMELMAKKLKGCAVSCGQWSSICLSDVPEGWQIHKDETALMHTHRPAPPYYSGSTCDTLFLQISNRNTGSWSAGTKTCTYDQHMQKTPPKKHSLKWVPPPSPNRFSLSLNQVPTDFPPVPQVPTDIP